MSLSRCFSVSVIELTLKRIQRQGGTRTSNGPKPPNSYVWLSLSTQMPQETSSQQSKHVTVPPDEHNQINHQSAMAVNVVCTFFLELDEKVDVVGVLSSKIT